MFKSVCILGRQPALGLAELESLYGANKLQTLGEQTVLVDVDPCLLAFDRLGGSIKFCKVLTELPTTNWSEIEKYLIEVSHEHSKRMVEGKMRLGLSLYGFNVPLKQIEVTGLKLKKVIKTTGRNVRVVPNKSAELSSAQVTHNQLTGPTGWELIFIKNSVSTVIVQTVKVQDIAAYTHRDRDRPKRDARVGMLPPKLAQIIINLAVGELPDEAKQSVCDIPAGEVIPLPNFNGSTVLDPFCGTGVILQEALLMGYKVRGTDLEPRMIEYSKSNLSWLSSTYKLLTVNCKLEPGDAITQTWEDFTTVASEAYLGRPFTSPPSDEVLRQTVQDVNTIIKKFLENLARQTKPGFRLCLALPAWHTKNDFMHLPLLDHLTDMGYNRISFVHVAEIDLIYHRPGQFVGRELVTLMRN